MRIPALHPGLYRSADLGSPADRALAARSSVPDRHPGHRQLAERVFEGEIVPRPMVAEQLLDTPRTAPLTTPAMATAAPAPTPGVLTAQSLFYLLHSSTERLGADPRGRNVDQFA